MSPEAGCARLSPLLRSVVHPTSLAWHQRFACGARTAPGRRSRGADSCRSATVSIGYLLTLRGRGPSGGIRLDAVTREHFPEGRLAAAAVVHWSPSSA